MRITKLAFLLVVFMFIILEPVQVLGKEIEIQPEAFTFLAQTSDALEAPPQTPQRADSLPSTPETATPETEDTLPQPPPPRAGTPSVPTPSPPAREATALIQPSALHEPTRPPFDPAQAYTVDWDSLVYLPGDAPTRVYSALEIYGKHLLTSASDLALHALPQPKNKDAFTSLILICLVLLAIARYFFPVRFKETLMALWEIRYYNQLLREGDFFRNWVSVFLWINYLISMGLLIYQTLWAFYPQALTVITADILNLAIITGAIFVFYLIKILLMYFLAWVFQSYSPTYNYLYNIVITNLMAGLAILPFLIANIYTPATVFVYIAWGLLLLINFYKIARGILIGLNAAGFSAYYLILYLCAIELAPLLFIIKYVQNLTLT